VKASSAEICRPCMQMLKHTTTPRSGVFLLAWQHQ
jgi:hypothetical protein